MASVVVVNAVTIAAVLAHPNGLHVLRGSLVPALAFRKEELPR